LVATQSTCAREQGGAERHRRARARRAHLPRAGRSPGPRVGAHARRRCRALPGSGTPARGDARRFRRARRARRRPRRASRRIAHGDRPSSSWAARRTPRRG
jgi:hypothetical protein